MYTNETLIYICVGKVQIGDGDKILLLGESDRAVLYYARLIFSSI